MNRQWWGAVAVTAGVALAVTGCSGGPSGSAGSSGTAAGASTSPASPTTGASTTATPSRSATPTSTLPAGVDQLITVSVANGKVTGPGGRVKVKKGSTVQLVVVSDIADEVHLHGYDKHVDVAKGGTATLMFKATLTGVFEVELEAKKLPLVKLQVA